MSRFSFRNSGMLSAVCALRARLEKFDDFFDADDADDAVGDRLVEQVEILCSKEISSRHREAPSEVQASRWRLPGDLGKKAVHISYRPKRRPTRDSPARSDREEAALLAFRVPARIESRGACRWNETDEGIRRR